MECAAEMTEAIGGKEWTVGQHVMWTAPDGRRRMQEVVGFQTNKRTQERMGVLDNYIAFTAEDVERKYVEECGLRGRTKAS